MHPFTLLIEFDLDLNEHLSAATLKTLWYVLILYFVSVYFRAGQEVSSKRARLTIPTALWPSVYIPLLPNMSQIEEVNVEPPPVPAPAPAQTRIIQPVRTQYIIQGNTVTHQMPAPVHQQKVHPQQQQQITQPQVIHVPPRTSHVSTISTPTTTSIRPIRVQQAVTSTPIVTSSSTPASTSHISTLTTPLSSINKATPRNRVMFEGACP